MKKKNNVFIIVNLVIFLFCGFLICFDKYCDVYHNTSKIEKTTIIDPTTNKPIQQWETTTYLRKQDSVACSILNFSKQEVYVLEGIMLITLFSIFGCFCKKTLLSIFDKILYCIIKVKK